MLCFINQAGCQSSSFTKRLANFSDDLTLITYLKDGRVVERGWLFYELSEGKEDKIKSLLYVSCFNRFATDQFQTGYLNLRSYGKSLLLVHYPLISAVISKVPRYGQLTYLHQSRCQC